MPDKNATDPEEEALRARIEALKSSSRESSPVDAVRQHRIAEWMQLAEQGKFRVETAQKYLAHLETQINDLTKRIDKLVPCDTKRSLMVERNECAALHKGLREAIAKQQKVVGERHQSGEQMKKEVGKLRTAFEAAPIPKTTIGGPKPGR